jgi:malic enzyme
VAFRGQALLNQPLLNKGTAFSREERRQFGLAGLLPPHISTLEQQAARAYNNIMRKGDPLEQYIGLISLQDRNETLFYRLLLEHIEQFLPIVYTPTVGLACQRYSHIYRRARGLWITPDHRGRIEQVLANAPHRDVKLIVVTDNERILGLGDLGAGGIGIPIGKLALYTLGAGIHPRHTLAISLDVGTDNQELLDDDLYLGWPHPRMRGEAYEAFVEEFVTAVRRTFPGVLLQWEDFKKRNAFTLLDRYRKRLLSFNDDIQGTAAIGTAAVIAASRLTGTPIAEQRVLMLGAGAAGVGIARQLRDLFQRNGLRGDDLMRAVLMMDSGGILHDGRDIDEATKQPFAWPGAMARDAGLPLDHPDDLHRVVAAYRPTVLLGTSGQPDVFTEPVVREMASHVERPVILPFSNPNSKCEAKPADLIAWTDGRATIASGSPFDPVEHNGRTHAISQGNNVYVFPGVGLGAMVAEANVLTDAMFTRAAETLAAMVGEDDLKAGKLFPPLSKLRPISQAIAEAVVREARDQAVGRPLTDEQIPQAVAAMMWQPRYATYQPVG